MAAPMSLENTNWGKLFGNPRRATDFFVENCCKTCFGCPLPSDVCDFTYSESTKRKRIFAWLENEVDIPNELVSCREAATLITEFLCDYQNILLSHRLDANASEVVVCKQNELIDEYAERIVQAMAAMLGGGTLTAEQVRDVIERHSMWVNGNNRCFHNGAYEDIAEELNTELGIEAKR